MRLSFLVTGLAALAAGLLGGLLVLVLDDDPPSLDEDDVRAIVSATVTTAVTAAVAEARSLDAVTERVLPGVVQIDAEQAPQRDATGNLVTEGSLGTGLVLNAEGYILTNEHIIRDAVLLTVILPDGRRAPATLVGSDAPFTDVAVLRIDAEGLRPVVFGSSAALAWGQTVVAVGHALLGEEPSITVGVVSNPATAFPREDYVQEHLIQTDAALNFGNSGGALATLNGEVVGLTTTIIRQTVAGDFIDGIAFALQADVIVPIAEAIVRDGRYPRPDFGVVEQRTLTARTAGELGLVVDRGAFLLEITRRGPLALAGLRPGDVILQLNEITIDEDTPYINALSRLRPDEPVTVVYSSNGAEQTVQVTPTLRQRRVSR